MKFHIYTSEHNALLEKYFLHKDTPTNNNSHKNIKSHLYDHHNGVLFFFEDNNEIVATFAVILVNLPNGVTCAKIPHRLHVRKDYTKYHNTFIDKFFEPAMYNWIEKNRIVNLLQTVNEGNERAGFVSWLRHQRRRKYGKLHVNDIGKQFIDGCWMIQPYLINEMYTWQYCAWVSLNGTQWNNSWRETKSIPPQIINKLNNNFKFNDQGWLL
jgi:hypothetical protein